MMPDLRKKFCAAVLSFGLLVSPLYSSGGPSNAQPAGGDIPAKSDFDTYPSEMQPAILRYQSDLRSLDHVYTLGLSPARQARLKTFYTEWLDSLGQRDFSKMSLEGKVDYVLFRNELEYELHTLDIEAKQYAEMQPLIPFAKIIFDFDEARRKMEPLNSAHAAELVAQIKKQVDETRAAVALGLKPEGKPESKDGADKAPAPAGDKDKKDKKEKNVEPIRTQKFVANRAANAITSLKKALKTWNTFYNGYDPAYTWWMAEPYKAADKALEDYRVFLVEQVVGIKGNEKEAIVGDPIGRDALLVDLAHEMIPYTPEELIALAKKEMAWCDAEMIKASHDLGYGDDWHAALEHVKSQNVEPGKQPEMIRKLAQQAVEFVDEKQFVTVPPLAREDWGMIMMTPERQLQAPFFLGGPDILVAYPTDTMTEEQKLMAMRGNNYGFAHATVFHELIPGHHLQGFMLGRYKSYRGLFRTPFWMEGWALYCELMFWDMGFDKTPEERIGALFWRMHRCARIIFSLSFHLGKMTAQECVDFLVERVGHERDNAAAEVRRSFAGDYSPLYQAGYLLGGFQIRALHKELVDSGKMTNRTMHDAFLREGTMPIEMVRALLTGQPPAKDFKTSWKFYGDVQVP
ncbi:MAG TPA: DUF885 family protein [Candidatus Acidoferrales bacterium]|nr:DUF885 family protein [Candidatus Acidoferrales bacterium]